MDKQFTGALVSQDYAAPSKLTEKEATLTLWEKNKVTFGIWERVQFSKSLLDSNSIQALESANIYVYIAFQCS